MFLIIDLNFWGINSYVQEEIRTQQQTGRFPFPFSSAWQPPRPEEFLCGNPFPLL